MDVRKRFEEKFPDVEALVDRINRDGYEFLIAWVEQECMKSRKEATSTFPPAWPGQGSKL